MPTAAPDQAVADRLAAQLNNAPSDPWSVGTNIFLGPVRPPGHNVPHRALFALATGGPAPQPYFGGDTAPSFLQPSVQVRVRSNPGDFAGGQTLARAAFDALNKAPLTGYLYCQPQQAQPIYLGVDQTDHHEWSINVLLWLVK